MRRREFALSTALLCVASLAAAQPLDGKQKLTAARPAEKLTAETKSPQQAFLDGERRMAFPKAQPQWHEVFEWFIDQSGLPFIGTVPAGVFQHASPPGATYTCTEAIDAMNEALGRIGNLLLRRNGVFTIIPADGPLDPNLIPRVAVRDLQNYGKTEIVQAVVPLKAMKASEIAATVEKGLGTLGSVTVLTAENQLLVTDSAGKLRRLVRAIQHVEMNDGFSSFGHKFVYLRARDAEASVRELVEQLPAVSRVVDFDLPLPAAKIRADERTNALFVSAPPKVIAQVSAHVRKIDQPQPPVDRPFFGPEFRNIDVPVGNAELYVRILSNLPQFRASPTFRMTAVSPERIVVYGFPDLRLQVELALALCVALPPALSEGLVVTVAQGTAIAEQLHGFLGDAKSTKRISKTASIR